MKRSINGNVATTISYKIRFGIIPFVYRYETGSATFHVYGIPRIIQNNSNPAVICEGGIVQYSIINTEWAHLIHIVDNPVNFIFNIQWDVFGSNLRLISGQGTTNATFSGVGNGSSRPKATITIESKKYICDGSSVFVGPPLNARIEGPNQICINEEYAFAIKADGNPDYDYYWDVPGEAYSTINDYRLDYIRVLWDQFNSQTYIGVPTLKNKCGSANGVYKTLTMPQSCWDYYHNYSAISASTDNFENATSIQNPNSNDNQLICSIKIFSVTGQLVYSSNSKCQNFDINLLEQLDNNTVYIVEKIFDDGNVKREKVLINKK